MEFSRDIQFGFKGGRDYVHGTDIYMFARSINEAVGSRQPRSIRFHDLLRGDATLEPLNSSAATKAVCTLHFDDANDYGLVQRDSTSIAARPYPEDEIVASSEISDTGAVLEARTGFDSIEEAIALIKSWSNRYRPIDGKWLFAKIDAIGESGPLPAMRTETVSIRHVGGVGRRFNRFEVLCDDAAAMVFFGARG
jgi:hypothetical protein